MAKRAKKSAGETTRQTKKRHQFLYEDSDAASVRVTGSFCDWAEDGYPLKKDKQGVWKISVPLTPGRHEYRFLVDGEWRDDPMAEHRVPNDYGGHNAIVEV